jgi:hypothetical protein
LAFQFLAFFTGFLEAGGDDDGGSAADFAAFLDDAGDEFRRG